MRLSLSLEKCHHFEKSQKNVQIVKIPSIPVVTSIVFGDFFW
jgi:hypothetical protein